MKTEIPPNLELQIKVSKLLSRGFVFSIVWIGGIGSLIAFISGLKARKIISQSNREIGVIKMAWWCIVVGALGMIILPLIILSNFKK
jgi:undecaprenyl pyrophosphate phosphatase UppP